MSSLENFPDEVLKRLGYYVYRLIDPRNGDTFYIGKGKGNRVFSHANGDIEKDASSEKMSRIRDIKLSGLQVLHVIHRHGMSETTAFEVESALIDAYPGLTNIMDGHGGDEVGIMSAHEIVAKYAAPIAVFEHNILMITINKSALEASPYEAVRLAWKVNTSKAAKADYVCAVYKGLIKGVFVVEKWLPATSENFPGFITAENRWGFLGINAPKEIQDLYLNKRVDDKYRQRGAANPIKYSWS
jgi:hypothetical protein